MSEDIHAHKQSIFMNPISIYMTLRAPPSSLQLPDPLYITNIMVVISARLTPCSSKVNPMHPDPSLIVVVE